MGCPSTRLRTILSLSKSWGGRIRTSEYGIQSPAPYRLATPQRGLQGQLQKIKCSGSAVYGQLHSGGHRPLDRGRVATGRPRRSCSARLKVRVTTALAPLRDNGLT